MGLANQTGHEGPPTTEEVVAVISKSRSEYLRKADRNVIRRLLEHRDELLRQKNAITLGDAP